MIEIKAWRQGKADSRPISLNITKFPDKTPKINIGIENIPFDPEQVVIIQIEWKYESMEELFFLQCICAHLREYMYSKDILILDLGYIPNARMDRVESQTEVFTLKTFCNIINSLNFHSVYVMDAHSNVSLSLLNNVRAYSTEAFIQKAIDDINKNKDDILFYKEGTTDNLILFYPDEGAMKRYSKLIRRPYAFGIKNRDWLTGEIKSLDIINKDLVKSKDVLIIDDICSRGGTFLHSAEALRAAGANKVYLYVTHAENTMYEGEMYRTPGLVDHIYTTDSIPVKHPNYSPDKVTIL